MNAYAPRRPDEAARWLSALVIAAVVLLLVITSLTAAVTPLVAAVVALDCAALLAGVVAIRRGWVPGARTWLVVVVASVAVVLASTLVTDDASAAAQISFLLPASLVDWTSVTAFTTVFVALLSRAADRQEALLEDLRRQARLDTVTGLSTPLVLDGGDLLATTVSVGTAHGPQSDARRRGRGPLPRRGRRPPRGRARRPRPGGCGRRTPERAP